MSEQALSSSKRMFLYSGWIVAAFLFGAWFGRFGGLLPHPMMPPPPIHPHHPAHTAAPTPTPQPQKTAPTERCAPTKAAPTSQRALTATDMQGIAFSRMAKDKRERALKLLNKLTYPCSCGQSIARCIQKDLKTCPSVQRIAEFVMDAINQGKSNDEIKKVLDTIGQAPAEAKAAASNAKPLPIPVQGAPSKGPQNAKLTVVIFSDFECPYCSQAHQQVEALQQKFGKENIRVVYRHLPLSFHPNAAPAAIASMAAHRQGKFWEYHDKLFANQEKLSAADFVRYAKELGLNLEKFQKDIKDPALAKYVQDDAKLAAKINVPGTPSFYLNGYAVGEQDNAMDVAGRAIKKAEEAIKRGVKPENVYEELIKQGK